VKKKEYEKVKNSYVNMGIGFEFIGIFAVPAIAGFWLDKYFEIENHWLLLTGVFLGFSYGIWYLYRRGKEMESEMTLNSEESRNDSVDTRAENIRKEIDILGEKINRLDGRKSERKRS
jgi:F0F1-type ATP synthase assembly protein I